MTDNFIPFTKCVRKRFKGLVIIYRDGGGWCNVKYAMLDFCWPPAFYFNIIFADIDDDADNDGNGDDDNDDDY